MRQPSTGRVVEADAEVRARNSRPQIAHINQAASISRGLIHRARAV
jgi:hypothetical protein